MKLAGNTIVIPEAGSFVMRELIERLYALGNTIIVGSHYAKHTKVLKKKKVPGSRIFKRQFHIQSEYQREQFAKWVVKNHPDVNGLILYSCGSNNPANFRQNIAPWAVMMELQNTILAPIHMTSLLTEQLLSKRESFIAVISPVSAVTPLWAMPLISAAHTALHAFTESLRYQLEDANVKVFELTQPFLEYCEITEGIELYDGIDLSNYCDRVLKAIEQDNFETRITAKSATDSIYKTAREMHSNHESNH